MTEMPLTMYTPKAQTPGRNVALTYDSQLAWIATTELQWRNIEGSDGCNSMIIHMAAVDQ